MTDDDGGHNEANLILCHVLKKVALQQENQPRVERRARVLKSGQAGT